MFGLKGKKKINNDTHIIIQFNNWHLYCAMIKLLRSKKMSKSLIITTHSGTVKNCTKLFILVTFILCFDGQCSLLKKKCVPQLKNWLRRNSVRKKKVAWSISGSEFGLKLKLGQNLKNSGGENYCLTDFHRHTKNIGQSDHKILISAPERRMLELQNAPSPTLLEAVQNRTEVVCPKVLPPFRAWSKCTVCH